jgi:hypothetical protein
VEMPCVRELPFTFPGLLDPYPARHPRGYTPGTGQKATAPRLAVGLGQ